VGRTARFGTKGLVISFISSDEEFEIFNKMQERFVLKIEELPATIDVTNYSKNYSCL